MTDEMNKLVNDPNYAIQFAVGEPSSNLVPQSRDSGIKFRGVYHTEVKQYIMKSAHMSREDLRMFDSSTGRMTMVSHYPGKNPYDQFDPLGTTNQDARYQVAGGEWQSVYEVSCQAPFQSFKIRPKWMSRHGRQYVKVGDNVILNVGKIGKLKSMSVRDHFMVGQGEDDELVYKCVADMTGRSIGIYNTKEELVANVSKSTKALVLTAALGHGSESLIDIAPGVDCSTILAVVYGLQQVGQHFMADLFDNYVADPLKGAVVDSAVEATGTQDVVNSYNKASNEAINMIGSLTRKARFFNDNFFK